MELGDALVVNKADGENRQRAENTRGELQRVLHYLRPYTEGWSPKARACSSLTGEGIPEVWELVEQFARETRASGVFDKRRRAQAVDWLHDLVEAWLKQRFYQETHVQERLPELERRIGDGLITPTAALHELMEPPQAGA
jgi:LAO/AO transport system kinase